MIEKKVVWEVHAISIEMALDIGGGSSSLLRDWLGADWEPFAVSEGRIWLRKMMVRDVSRY